MLEDANFQELEMTSSGRDVYLPSRIDELLLVRESNHRFANTLAVIAVVLRRELANSISAETRRSFELCESRIVAFGTLHRSLVVGGLRGRIPLNEYMESLCQALTEAILKPLGIKCELVAQAGEFPAERCERLGLVVAELVTNAAKHAFCGRVGTVRVSVLEDAQSLICVISDNGVGKSVGTQGAGSQILEQLVCAMDGTMVVKSGRAGTSVAVTCKSTTRG